MTKADLVTKMAETAGLTKLQAEKALSAFTGTVETALKAGDKVTLVGFGTFSAATRAARTGRNPQTGEEIQITAKTNGKFTPGSALKDIGPKEPPKPVAKAPAKKAAAPAKAKTKK